MTIPTRLLNLTPGWRNFLTAVGCSLQEATKDTNWHEFCSPFSTYCAAPRKFYNCCTCPPVYTKGSGKPSITWPESVDQALCYGWIDGIRKSIDETSYKIRFTPRKVASIWSSVNIKQAEALIEQGQMQPAGLKAYQARKKSGVY